MEHTKPTPATAPPCVALTGNPNCGKTTIFNALTGLRAKVGNYAGVTVERKEGRLIGNPANRDIRILDLPGTYSLSPNSIDEQISRDVLLNRIPNSRPPTSSSSSWTPPTCNATSTMPRKSSSSATAPSSP